MHTIDLSKYNIRTDILIDNLELDINEDIYLDEQVIEKDNTYNKKAGLYKTIIYKDITDKDNFKKVLNLTIKALSSMLKETNIQDTYSCLIVGLGNKLSTPDALGPKVIEHILVTRHLFLLGEVEKGYRPVSVLTPGVMGSTGIESKDIIKGVIEKIKPDFLIIVDALMSSSLNRLNKTIQISNTGITPGSGVGNSRSELTQESLNIPVIAIGIPTIVDAATIVHDTIKYMLRQFSYKLDNVNNTKLKLVPSAMQNYLDQKTNLSNNQKKELLGLVGTLNDEEIKSLIYEVLTPINYNLMVTPKEVDFQIEKLSLLLAKSINTTLHKSYNSTQ